MKQLHVVSLCAVALLTTTPAWAQYGLYGSPKVLDLPGYESQQAPSYGYAGTQRPAHQPAYRTSLGPADSPSLYPSSDYSYPATQTGAGAPLRTVSDSAQNAYETLN